MNDKQYTRLDIEKEFNDEAKKLDSNWNYLTLPWADNAPEMLNEKQRQQTLREASSQWNKAVAIRRHPFLEDVINEFDRLESKHDS